MIKSGKKSSGAGKQKWQPISFDNLDLLSAFQKEGGVAFERLDPADISILTHQNGVITKTPAGKTKKPKKKLVKSAGRAEEERESGDKKTAGRAEEEPEKPAASAPETSAGGAVAKKKKWKAPIRIRKRKAAADGTTSVDGAGEDAEPPAKKRKSNNAAVLDPKSSTGKTTEPSSSAVIPAESSSSDGIDPAILATWSAFPIHPTVAAGVARLGFAQPSPIQQRCLLPALAGKDIVGAAETGSGKTLAFGLPLLDFCLRSSCRGKGLAGLILLPTRELAQQVKKELDRVRTGIVIGCFVGGLAVEKQLRILKGKPSIVCGTPGRCAQLAGLVGGSKKNTEDGHVAQMSPWFRDALECVKFLVLDEADRMVEPGHFRDMLSLLGHIYAGKRRNANVGKGKKGRKNTAENGSENGYANEGDENGDGGEKIVGEDGEELEGEELERVMEEHGVEKTDNGIVDLGELQTLLFSATLATRSDQPGLQGLVEKVSLRKNKLATVDLSHDRSACVDKSKSSLPESLRLEECCFANDHDRDALLSYYLLSQIKLQREAVEQEQQLEPLKMIVFTNAVTSVHRLCSVLNVLLGAEEDNRKLQQLGLSKMKAKQRKKRRNNKGNKNSAEGAGEVSRAYCEVLPLHSNMMQKDRLRKMDRFRGLSSSGSAAASPAPDAAASSENNISAPPVSNTNGNRAPPAARILVCTDLAARGLDVKDVNFVIHYHVPRSTEIFVHRTGRTARAGRAGTALILRSPEDSGKWVDVLGVDDDAATQPSSGAAASTQPSTLQLPQRHVFAPPPAKEFAQMKAAVQTCTQLEADLHKMQKNHAEESWFRKHAQELDLAVSSEEEGGEETAGVDKAKKGKLTQMYWQLQQRLEKYLGAA